MGSRELEFIYRAAVEKQTQRRDVRTRAGEEGRGEMCGESNRGACISMCKVDRQWEGAV